MLKQKFGDKIPSVKELKQQTSLMFVNSHYSLSGVKPLSPAVIEVGGIHIKEPKPLKQVTWVVKILKTNDYQNDCVRRM